MTAAISPSWDLAAAHALHRDGGTVANAAFGQHPVAPPRTG